MPKLGAADIDAVYLGGSVVDKLYLGSSAVYTAISPPDAPTNVAITVEEDYAAPSQVTGLAVDSTGDGTIDLSWTAPASEAAITDYRVEYTPSGGSAAEVLVGSNATSYQLTGLTNDTEYSVRVAAISAGGQGDYSAAVTGTPGAAPPGPPGEPATVFGSGTRTANWTPPEDDGGSPITGYRVLITGGQDRITGEPGDSTYIVGPDARSQVLGSGELIDGTVYFTVYAFNAYGEGPGKSGSRSWDKD